MEVWKDVIGFEGLYQASSLGRFRSLDCERPMKNGIVRFYPGHILSTTVAHDGYAMIDFTDRKGVRRTYKAHRVVAGLFVNNPFNLPIVNHKNENKTDNRADNLEWCSNRYNLRYGSTQKRRVDKIGWKVRVFDMSGKYIKTYFSMRAAARLLKIPMSGIYKCCNGEIKSYKGYRFQVIKDGRNEQNIKERD